MKFSVSSISKIGPRRVNEDCLAGWFGESDEFVACIADGLGGMGGGDVASKLAVNEFQRHLKESGANRETILAGANSAHGSICEMQSSGGRYSQMSTTFTAVVLSDENVMGVHCGDSRAMLTRGDAIRQLTTDHTEGERLFAAGMLSESELVGYARNHILESALGVPEDPRIDQFQSELLPGDHVLLTTDGVHNLVSLQDMGRLSSISSTPSDLVKRVDDAIRECGPIDNYSMIAIYAD